MLVSLLKSKLHGAAVTEARLDYEGSLGIDRELMDRVKIRPYEKILVANLRNGERFETYAIVAPAGSRTICLNGAAAHLGTIGDRIIIMAFALVDEAGADGHTPLVLALDENNRPRGNLRP